MYCRRQNAPRTLKNDPDVPANLKSHDRLRFNFIAMRGCFKIES